MATEPQGLGPIPPLPPPVPKEGKTTSSACRFCAPGKPCRWHDPARIEGEAQITQPRLAVLALTERVNGIARADWQRLKSYVGDEAEKLAFEVVDPEGTPGPKIEVPAWAIVPGVTDAVV